MKVLAALLLTVLLFEAVSPNEVSLDNETSSTHIPSTIKSHLYDEDDSAESLERSSSKSPVVLPNEYKPDNKSSPIDAKISSNLKKGDLHFLKPFRGPKEMLLQEIRILNEETKTQEEVAQTFKAEAKRIRPLNFSTTAKPIGASNVTENSGISKWVPDEDIPYEDDLSEDEEDENDDEYDDGDEDDDENDDEPEYDEQVMTQCPDYCKCAGEYAAATTATCTKFVEQQFFGTGIVHLRIENAGQIRLGPLAFQSRGFQQLESIVITDTRIVELNQTAFDGIPYLFSVNLTRNDLQDIHPSTFQSNMQLSLLCISGNPLKHTQDLKLAKHGLFDAPSVTEFDFSFNGLMKLKRTAFTRMKSLTYINLKGNKLKEIDSATFNMLESLVELDLSNNLLNKIPNDLFPNNDIQMLRVAGNNLITLNTIQASKLRLLDVSNNKIKVIAKDDLSGVPLLDQLMISSNGLKRIHQHAFANLDQLNHLDISDNKLTSLTEHHLRANSRLQVLLMNNNPELGALPIFKTFGLEYDTYSVYRFECSNCGLYFLEEGTFNAMPAITQLNLSRNRLMVLPNGLLNLSSLRILDLSDNIINTLESNMFRGASSLTKISLAGNPLTTLQVTPFLMTPSLTKLDVSRCALERIWSETRTSLPSLRSLSVRQNLLRRITVEELNATPKLVSLDLSHNPLNCDVEFNEAVQWLTDHAVTPIETLRYISNYGNTDNYPDSEGISQWTDLGKTICNDTSTAPQPRPVPHKEKKLTIFLGAFDTSENPDPLLRSNAEGDDEEEILKLDIDHGIKSNEIVEKAWTTQDQEYEDFIASENMEYHPWYTSALWSVIMAIVITSMILLLTVHIAIHLAKRRGQGPVIRPPMILRQGFIDNKNCGLVYKPLQEEIATPHVPKRGSFYSCSTFHYDKIVPESV